MLTQLRRALTTPLYLVYHIMKHSGCQEKIGRLLSCGTGNRLKIGYGERLAALSNPKKGRRAENEYANGKKHWKKLILSARRHIFNIKWHPERKKIAHFL
ncbi:hypothetical protein [Butyricicoccus porcorum]|uniref:Uncharacterized protein n=1 Tax=Butyricicoccus porcorum TaxID=1945634 RepID=A0A252F1H7_9FIRM|nr:hypothetical protein [Butyricicoccus porcorum]OUM19648.1 hypothetical protein CBW42_12020 [Butyricicoccus porcorum]